MSDNPKPAEPARRPSRAEALEQLRADYLALETEAKYVFKEPRR